MHLGTSKSIDDKYSEGARQASVWSGQNTGARGGLLEWWYHLAAPQEPENSNSRDRELVRAGRLSSIILLLMLFYGFTLLPTALNGMSVNHIFPVILLVAMTINVGAFVLNRQGKVILVGVLMVVAVEAAFMLTAFTSPRGLSTRSLTSFELIVLTELMAVSLLPPRSVFLVMLCNFVYTWGAITFLPHASDLVLSPLPVYYGTLAGPMALQFIVALVTYLWVQGARQAIARAEHVAELEHTLAERDREAAERKVQLEHGIQQVLHTQIQAANGKFDVRAPLARDNVLWQVAYSLNNLLARLQRASQAESELHRTDAEVGRMVAALREARAGRHPVIVTRSTTVLDPLVQELNGQSFHQQ